jgi:hypothetical protein
MREPATTKRRSAHRGTGRNAEQRELALLEEFTRSASVAALAQRIAARLGPRTRSENLIADAGLGPATRDH